MNETMRTLMAHRSIRRYTGEPVADEDIRAAVRAGQMASTSSAVQAYCVIRVRDAAKRRAIAEISGPQEKVATAPEFFVICGDARRHRLACERAGRPYEQRLEGFLIAVIDATLFAQNMAVALESMGYGLCYIGGIRNDLPRVGEVLGLPAGVYPLFGLCVGRPAESPSERPRLPEGGVLFEDAYPDDDELLRQLDEYDAAYRRYLEERGARPKGWSEAMVEKLEHASRVTVGLFYRGQGADLS